MEIWASAIGCVGSIFAALIGAITSIIVAKMGKEKSIQKAEQNAVAQNVPSDRNSPPPENKMPSTIKPNQLPTNTDTPDNKLSFVLGITAVLGGLVMSCAPGAIFAVPAIIFGIVALVSKKKWAGITGWVLNIAGIIFSVVWVIFIFIILPYLGPVLGISNQP